MPANILRIDLNDLTVQATNDDTPGLAILKKFDEQKKAEQPEVNEEQKTDLN